MQRSKKIWTGIAVATVVVGGAGATAWADTGGATTTTPPAATAPAAKDRGILRRADHGAIEVKRGGKWVTVDFDRGKVTDVAADHITLARPDGQSVTLKITQETKFHGAASAADVQVGKGALVVSNPDGTATQVVQPQAAKK